MTTPPPPPARNDELLETFEKFISLQSSLIAMTTLSSEDELWQQALNTLRNLIDFPHYRLLLYRSERKELVRHSSSGPESDDLLFPDDLVEWIFTHRSVTLLPAETTPDTLGVRSVLPLPLIGKKGNRLGLFLLWGDFEETSTTRFILSFLDALALHLSTSLENLRLQQHIQQVSGLMDNILESVPHAIIAVAKDDRIQALNTNAEFMFGIKRFFVLGERFQDVFAEELSRMFSSLTVATLGGQEAIDQEYEHRLHDGTPLTVGISSSLIYDKNNAPQGLLFICRDLSLSRELQKLRELDRMKSEFLHTVSHELKTPLTAILGGAEILQVDKDKLDEDLRSIIDIISEGGKRLHSLIINLLDLSRLESGRVALDERACDLVALIRDTIPLVARLSDKHKIVTRFTHNSLTTALDPEKIKQVVTNLLSNAIKYSPAGGEVTVSYEVRPGEIAISVADQGIGIPPEHIPHMFEKFYRVDSSSTAEIEGTGLGLSIVKHIVEMHGGKVTVASAPGKGSTFTFTIPLKPGPVSLHLA